MKTTIQILLVVIVAGACSLGAAQDRERRDRGFDLERYVKGLDKNGNEMLDTNEISGRTRDWLQKSGFDPSRPISISKVLQKVNKDKKEKERVAKREANRKVPGFGVEAEKTEVSNFTAAGTAASGGVNPDQEYGAKIMEQVDSTLRRYDRNNSGSLEREEIERARWGSPRPEEFDRNKDGTLTRTELAERYAARERASSSSRSPGSSSSDRSSSNSSSSDRDSTSSRDRWSRSRFSSSSNSNDRGSTSGSSPSSSSRLRSSSSDGSSSSRFSSSRNSSTSKSSFSSSDSDKYRRYAEGLIKQYDKDKDGRISKAETKEMRRPPTDADSDKDGFITKDELIASLSGGNNSTSSVATGRGEGSTRPTSSFRSRSERSRSGSSSKSRRPVSFSEDDANKDGQIQMHEYSDEWDQQILEEFRRRDLNNDGVITAEEWKQSGR